MGNIVAIVGRPNVGKSTLFNRLTESRDAIVKEVSGVTRDRIYGKGEWNGYQFSVIDTGGYIKGSDDVFEGEIRRQVELAIDEADAIIFMVDVEEGLLPLETPSAQQSGLKLNLNTELEAGFSYTFILDWDVQKSIVKAGNSGIYNLKPVIRVVAEVNSGTIKGRVADIDETKDGTDPMPIEGAT